jgi:hypothetical protein
VKRIVWLCIVVAMLASAPVAAAGSSLRTHGSQSAQSVVAVKSSTQASGPPSAANGAEGLLSFTEIDLAMLVGAGVLLLAVRPGGRRIAGEKG